MTEMREVSLGAAFIPIFVLVLLLSASIYTFGDDSLGGANQICLILAAAVATLVAFRYGHDWERIQKAIIKTISSAMAAMLILLLIGSLAGTWLISGIVPAMIYYGLDLLNPNLFLAAACAICAVVSLATGSSWTTSATVGIALIGIARALDIPEAIAAGAIISGAYFGDKLSPLSDTTNLAPAMAGTDLFTHIRYMTLTTIPSITISLILFLIIGFSNSAVGDAPDITPIQAAIASKFDINLWLFLVPLLVVVLIVKKVPALLTIFLGAILGALFAVIFQPEIVRGIGNEFSGWQQIYVGLMTALFGDVAITTENEMVNELLSSGGMKGMLNTVWLILSAMIFGGVMEVSGMLARIAKAIISFARSTVSLVSSTVATCIFANIATPDQYLSIVVAGRMYNKVYRERGLAPQNLSRTLEDSATVTSVLVPWNTCGAYQASVLGVATLSYLPFAFFNLISPLMTILFAAFAIKIARLPPEQQAAPEHSGETGADRKAAPEIG